MKRLALSGLDGLGEIRAGDSVGGLICDTCARQQISLQDNDVLVVAQKIISKAEGRVRSLNGVTPSPGAFQLGHELSKDPELVETILSESRRIVRRGGRALIVETHQGFICANAGVDQSNVGLKQVTLLPEDPDRSARQLRSEIYQRTGKRLAVIISDSL